VENWNYELQKAYEDGRKAGVTEGYKNGFSDGQRVAKTKTDESFGFGACCGYNTHLLDVLDILFELLESNDSRKIDGDELMDRMDQIYQIRNQLNIYIKHP